jgi:hypothetical protein
MTVIGRDLAAGWRIGDRLLTILYSADFVPSHEGPHRGMCGRSRSAPARSRRLASWIEGEGQV